MKKITTWAVSFGALIALGSAADARANVADRQCREYTRTIYIGGQAQQGVGTACLQPDGSWQIVSDEYVAQSRVEPQPEIREVVVYRDRYYPQPRGYWGPRSGLSISVGQSWYAPRHYRSRGYDRHARGHRHNHHRAYSRR